MKQQITIKDIFKDTTVLGLLLVTVLFLVIIFSQDWGVGLYLVSLPGILGFLAIYYRVLFLMKSETAIQNVPVVQYPFGEEKYMQATFSYGYIIAMILLITLGYEAIIYPLHFETLLASFIFLMSLTSVFCMHLATNKVWMTGRIELRMLSLKKGSKLLDEGELPEFNYSQKLNKYVLWSPSQASFNGFTTLNIVLFIVLFLVLMGDLVLLLLQDLPVSLSIIPVTLPAVSGANVIAFLSPVSFVVFGLDLTYFIVVQRRIFNEIMNYDINEIVETLVKVEVDDDVREKIVLMLEKIKTSRLLNLK